MRTYTKWILSGLFLGVIIHVFTVIALPHFQPNTIWTQIVDLGDPDSINVLDSASVEETTIPMLDPLMEHAFCRFSTLESPRLIHGQMRGLFWSVGIFNKNAEVVFSLNNQMLQSELLSLVIANSDQVQQLESRPVNSPDNATIVEVPDEELFVIVRVYRSDPTLRETIRSMLNGLKCEMLENT